MFLPKFFSFLFHPVFMPLIGLFIIFNSGIYTESIPVNYSRFLFIIVFLCNVAIPVSIIPALIYVKNLDNINIDDKRQRLIPLFFTAVCFYGGYFIVSRFSHSMLINAFLLSGTLIVSCLFLISFFWKISMHMAGIGGLTGLIIVLSIFYKIDMAIILSTAILITGFIATSRLALSAHSIIEILAGYFLGLIIVMIIMS
jgi:hypothetical protein